jgi:hypothetical protein
LDGRHLAVNIFDDLPPHMVAASYMRTSSHNAPSDMRVTQQSRREMTTGGFALAPQTIYLLQVIVGAVEPECKTGAAHFVPEPGDALRNYTTVFAVSIPLRARASRYFSPYGRSEGLLAVTLLGIGAILTLFGTKVPSKPARFDWSLAC